MSTPEQRMRMAKPDRRFRGPPRQEGTSPGLQASGLGRRRPLRGGRHQREIQQGSLRPSGGVDRGRRVRQAEELATEFIASDTDVVVTWSKLPAIEFYLRDSVFNWEDPQPKNPEHIRILATWEHDNIVEIPIPQLNKTAIGPRAPSTIRFHRLGAAQLQLWKEWEKARPSRPYSFFWRRPRAVLRARQHDHAVEPLLRLGIRYQRGVERKGHRPALVGEKGSVRKLVPITHKWGFWWGGHFSTPDSMHFEVAVLK
jgi:hypothetical protein